MKRILVVDDEPFARTVFKKLIEESFFDIEVVEAEDGMQAWEKMCNGKFDLAILDINMPIINGIELIEKIRLQPNYAETPCIVVSSNTSSEVQEQVKDLGVVEVISKVDVSSRVSDDNRLLEVLKKYIA